MGKYLFKRNKDLLFWSFTTFFFLSLIYFVSPYNGFYYYRRNFCLADEYLWFLHPINYGIFLAPILITIFLFFINNLERIEIVLSLQTIRKWVNLNVKTIVLLSAIVSITTIVIITFFACIQVQTVLNWSEVHSLYCFMTKHTNSKINIWSVIIFSYLIMFSRNIVLGLGTYFLKVLTNSNIVALIIMIAITPIESFSTRTYLLYRFINLDYTTYEHPQESLICIVYCLFIITALYLLILRYSKRKEWFREKQK